MRLWDNKGADCLKTWAPPATLDNEGGGGAVVHAIHSLQPMPTNSEHVLVCARTKLCHLCTMEGKVHKDLIRIA